MLLFSSFQVVHQAGMGFYFIVIVPCLPSCCSFFVFGCGVYFFGVFHHLPVDGCTAAGCDDPIHRGAWWATVHGVAKSHSHLSDYTAATTGLPVPGLCSGSDSVKGMHGR